LPPFLLEAVKKVWRRFVAKDPAYDFPKIFYTLTIPFSTLVCQVALGYVGWAVMPDVSFSYVAQWFFGIIVTMGTYYLTIKQQKSYSPNNY
jgi:hypothetical protein